MPLHASRTCQPLGLSDLAKRCAARYIAGLITGSEATDWNAMSTPRPRPKVMTMTAAAAERVHALMAAKGPEVAGLRIGVKKGGCAGMEYTMTWADSVGRLEEVVERDGARVIVEPQAVLYLLGTEMDYKVEKLSAQFVFNNPNQKSACGCGESVSLVPASRDRLEQAEA